MGEDDEEARRRRAQRLRELIESEPLADRPPRTPREFAERAAREAARAEAEEEAKRRREAGQEDG